MEVAAAWKRSKVRIAVRGLGGPHPRYIAEPYDPRQLSEDWSPKSRSDAINYCRHRTYAKQMPEHYAAFHDDWEPWDGKDPITMLGDLVRLEGRARMIA